MAQPSLRVAVSVAACIAVALLALALALRSQRGRRAHGVSTLTCGSHSCSAMDPVSDPAYNMKQVVKQSILLEEHLTHDRKRCRDCQLKHMLHIQGLVEEAAMMAGDGVGKYPMLVESVGFYEGVLKGWLTDGKSSVAAQNRAATELRVWRKKLAAAYFLG